MPGTKPAEWPLTLPPIKGWPPECRAALEAELAEAFQDFGADPDLAWEYARRFIRRVESGQP